ncbi:MAG: iron-sulfur cluster assembly scaffold protein [Candidatus Diapherotrites archaeon]
MYSERVRNAFLKPHHMGKMENPDGIGTVGNLVCGDVMYLYIKVGKGKNGKEKIKDIKWETFGCAAAIATSSTVADIAIGKTLEDAIELSNQGIVESLGGLPSVKVHCSVLAVDALHEAIYDYLKKNKKPIPEKLEKRHLEIQKEMAELRERYKNIIAEQEKMLKGKK